MPVTDWDILPCRRFLPADVKPKLDDLGFLSSDASHGSIGIESLLDRHAVLVLGPPWLGKTYVAERLQEGLRHAAETDDQFGFGKYFELSSPRRMTSPAKPLPTWWKAWQRRVPIVSSFAQQIIG